MLKEAAIGDTVVLGAALSDLRAAFPQAHIILFVGDSNHAFAKLMTVPDEVELLPLSHPYACIQKLRQRKLDLLFDAGQWPRINAILSRLSGARHTVGFETPGQYRSSGYDTRVRHDRGLHEVDNFRRLLGFGNAPDRPATFGIAIEDSRPVSAQFYAVLHLWPGGERSEIKQWPEDRWVAVGRHLVSRGLHVVLTGTRGDQPQNDRVIAALPPGSASNLAGLPIRLVPTLLKQAQLVVSVNTGLMHIAAILDVPTVGLHGPTSAARWGPLGSRSVPVVSRSAQSQYLNLGFEYPPSCNAMAQLETRDVIAAADQLLGSRRPAPVAQAAHD